MQVFSGELDLWQSYRTRSAKALLGNECSQVPGWKETRGRYSTDAWVGRCGPGVNLFKTQLSDFSIPFETEFKIFRPY